MISREKEILLDDGTVTIMLQKKFFAKKLGLRSYYKDRKAYTMLLIYSYLFSFNFDDSPPHLFSMFNLNKWLSSGQKNIKNANTPCRVESLDCFYFFGAKYSEAGLFSLEVELKLLKFVFDYIESYYEKSINYIAHRDDSEVKLTKIKNLGVKIKRLGSPCEIYFKEHNHVPKFIGGFYTTSLITLPNLFEVDDVISFDLTGYMNSESAKVNTRYIYSYLKINDVEVIPVPLGL